MVHAEIVYLSIKKESATFQMFNENKIFYPYSKIRKSAYPFYIATTEDKTDCEFLK